MVGGGSSRWRRWCAWVTRPARASSIRAGATYGRLSTASWRGGWRLAVSEPAALAFVGGAAGAVGFAELLSMALRRAAVRAPGLAAALAESVARVGREGRDPVAVERRRLLLAAGAIGLIGGLLIAGLLVGLALAAGAPWLAARALRARRDRYR